MRKQRNAEKQKRINNRKKVFCVLVEVAFMVLGILCSIMPAPFPLLVPIAIGTVRIISKSIEKDKDPAPVVYCNGAQEPKHSATKTASATKQQPQRKNAK